MNLDTNSISNINDDSISNLVKASNDNVYFMNKKTSHSLINIGTGKEDTIKGIAQLFLKTLIPEKKIQIKFDKSKPNGIKRKVLDISLAKKYGWTAKNEIRKAIIDTYINFKLLNWFEKFDPK